MHPTACRMDMGESQTAQLRDAQAAPSAVPHLTGNLMAASAMPGAPIVLALLTSNCRRCRVLLARETARTGWLRQHGSISWLRGLCKAACQSQWQTSVTLQTSQRSVWGTTTVAHRTRGG